MIFNGNNYLSLSYQTGLSFSVDVTIDNLNGNCNLGFSGQNKNLNFKLDQGKVFDPENRLVYFYEANENINISGNISPDKYSYYINDNLICLNGDKNYYTISGYYINTSNCNADSEVTIQGTRPDYSLNLSPIFYITGTNYLTGSINNSNNLNFKIYSGSISIPSGFGIQNISNFVSNTGYFQINHYPITSGQLEDERLYEVQLNLFTNFGQVTQNFTTTGSYSGYINVNLSTLNITDFFARTGIQTGLGDYKENNFFTNFNIISGSLRSVPTELNKYLHVKLEYTGGNTGNFNYNIFASGYKNDTITGFISGTGYLSKQISFAGSGYDDISGVSRTGYITGIIRDLFSVTGLTSQTVNLTYSGYVENYLVTLSSNYNAVGTAIDGQLNYYSYIYNNIYNDTVQISGSDLQANDFFGNSVAINTGKLIVVGNSSDDLGSYANAGSAYIFSGRGNQYTQILKITGTNLLANDSFGTSVDVSPNGSIIFIGASGKDLGSSTNVGSVYSFTGSISNRFWAQNVMITGSDGASNDAFGTCLQASELANVLAVGAPKKTNGSYTAAGAAYIFTGSNANWAQVIKITGNDLQANNNFGTSIGLSNNATQIIVGSPNNNIGTYNNVGSVYIFTGDGISNWRQAAKITGSDAETNDNFGYSVSMNSNCTVIAIGATGKNSSAGNVYIFTGNGTTSWAQKQKISASDAAAGDNFGFSVKINSNGNKIFVGARNDSYNSFTNAGSIYVFTGNGINWAEEAKITGNNITSNRNLGYSIDLGNTETCLVGGVPAYDVGTYTDAGSIKVIDYMRLSGFIEQIVATGNISSTSSYLATGNIIGNSFKKIFTEVFELFTGIYISGNPTGIVDFNANNFIQNGYYIRSGIVNSGVNDIFIQVKTKNYSDNNALTGKLTISGYTLDNKRNSVNIQYITGVK
jgi:hypothetical protein